MRRLIIKAVIGVFAIAAIAAFAFTGCSPGYVLRAAWEEGKLLASRRDITDIVNDPAVGEEQRERLKLVQIARLFAEHLGLNPGGSFTTYAEIEGEALSWVVMASRKDAFEPYTWWFPIVGRVPYKGYFDKEDAVGLGADLEKDGYEVWVRGAGAMSTLGWFNDPVLSTTLMLEPVQIVNTVLHESLHNTVWIPDHVAFNESMATFVGMRAAVDFFDPKFGDEKLRQVPLSFATAEQYTNALSASAREYELEHVVDGLFQELAALYQSSATHEEKLQKRVEAFERFMGPVRSHYPKLRILREINNAEILQLRLYLTGLHSFDQLFTKHANNWQKFLSALRDIKLRVESENGDPYTYLAEALS